MKKVQRYISLETLAYLILFLYPVVHKVRIKTGIAVHPVELGLLFMWICLGLWFFRWARAGKPVDRKLRMALPLIVSFAGLIMVMELSNLIMALRGVSPTAQDLLLPVKYLLYLAPLPFFTLVLRSISSKQITRIVFIIAVAGLITVMYSVVLVGNVFVTPVSPDDVFLEYKRMEGFLGEIYNPGEGILYRKDTVGHGAYGEYISLVAILAISYSLNGGLNFLARAFFFLVGLTSIMAVSQTSSRVSALLLVLGFMLLPLFLRERGDRKRAVTFLVLLVLSGFVFKAYLTRYTVTFYKYDNLVSQELPADPGNSGESAQGVVHPGLKVNSSDDSSYQGRSFILRKSLAYVRNNPWNLLSGIGFSRDNFLREVTGSAPRDDHQTVKDREFQTAHNLFLDILIKCGIPGLLLIIFVWIFLLFQPLIRPMADRKGDIRGPPDSNDIERSHVLFQAGFTAFLVPLLLVNFFQEELLVDIILFHVMCLSGVFFCSLDNRRTHVVRDEIKVVHLLCSGKFRGGGNTHVVELAEALSALGHPQWIIAPPKAEEKTFVSGEDISAVALPVHRLGPITALRVLWVTLKNKADIFHSHGRGAGLYSIIIGSLSGKICVHTPHGPHFLGMTGLSRKAEILSRKLVALSNDVNVYVSEGEQEIFKGEKITRGRGVVIENGLSGQADPGLISFGKFTAREKLGLPSETLIIGTIARLNYQKGIDDLIEVASVLLEYWEAIFIVIGDGPEKKNLEMKLQSTRLGRNFLFTGEISDAHRYLPAIDIYVSTSRWEGLPYTIIEAMSNGIPIVATDVVGNRDALRYGGGLLVPPGEHRHFAKELVRLIEDTGLYLELVKAGRDIVIKQFSLKGQIEKTLAIYQENLLAEREEDGQFKTT